MTAVLSQQTTPADLTIFDSMTAAAVASYQENGFALLGAALSPDEVAEINAEAVRLCRGELGNIAATAGEFDDDGSDACRFSPDLSSVTRR